MVVVIILLYNMGVHESPISDYEGDEDCVDINGMVRSIDLARQELVLVDATGDFTFYFSKGWETDIEVGDFVKIRGIPHLREEEYTIVGVKTHPLSKVSEWELSNPRLAHWTADYLFSLYQLFGWLKVDREAVSVPHGFEIYCNVRLESPFVNENLGCVPEAYVFNWEVDHAEVISTYEQYAGEVSLEQLMRNAEIFYDIT